MSITVRSCLTAGVAIITAAAVAFVPSVQEPRPAAPPPAVVHVASPPITLTAQVQPLALSSVPNLLAGWLEKFIVPPSAGQPFPTPSFPPTVSGTGIDSTIKNVYNAIEPWVRYGFELATYAVGWVPYVGWLSGQIMIFYNFGERIARSITYNIADFLGGNVSFVQGLINVGVATVHSFIQLGIDEWNYFLPPLPPLPPLPFAAAAPTTESVTTLKATDTAQDPTDSEPVKTPKGPKTPKAPKTAAITSQDEVSDTPTGNDTEPAKGADQKKADKGPKPKGATNSTDSSTSKADDGTKHADKGGKKDDTGKKAKKGADE